MQCPDHSTGIYSGHNKQSIELGATSSMTVFPKLKLWIRVLANDVK